MASQVVYTHPDLPKLIMTGVIKHDAWENIDMFYPNQEFHEKLLQWFGYEPEAGLYLDGATISKISE